MGDFEEVGPVVAVLRSNSTILLVDRIRCEICEDDIPFAGGAPPPKALAAISDHLGTAHGINAMPGDLHVAREPGEPLPVSRVVWIDVNH